MKNNIIDLATQQPKCVLITGCSSGIGYYTAHQLKRRGYRVFASARSEHDVKRLIEEGLESLVLDLRDPNSIEQAFNSILNLTGGHLFALFNNGAYGQPGAIEDLSREALASQFETNVFGWHDLTVRVVKVMRAQGYGRIIQNSSILGFIGLPYRGAYNASKFAIEGLSDTLRLELRGSDIHISLIEPGPIESRFRHNSIAYFKQNIDVEQSAHKDNYLRQMARLEKKGSAVPFTLPPHAVYEKVLKVLESKRPNARYYVTFPTYLFGYLKRLLTSRALDRLLAKI